jgi:hypothetical protein
MRKIEPLPGAEVVITSEGNIQIRNWMFSGEGLDDGATAKGRVVAVLELLLQCAREDRLLPWKRN